MNQMSINIPAHELHTIIFMRICPSTGEKRIFCL